jgi:hypothetical protein
MFPIAMEEECETVPARQAEFVPVVFADNREAADNLVALLERHNIPAYLDEAIVAETVWDRLGRGVPVLAPARLHDTATRILALDEDDEEEMDDFDTDDEDDVDFDDDDLDDLDDLDDDYEDDEDEDEDDFDPDLDDDDDLD